MEEETMQEDYESVKPQHTGKIIIIGGGLSGLSAAEKILTELPNTTVTVLEAMSEVGGRTFTTEIQGANFDLGGTWVGKHQKYVRKLAERAKNELIHQYHKGDKILDINNKISVYKSDIPYDVGIFGLAEMQFNIWKIDRMAKKLSKEDTNNCPLRYKWDAQTVRSWLESNIFCTKVKILLECAVRAIFGCETDELSFLFFLHYIRQNGGVNNLINIHNGLQEKKMVKGAQYLSLFLKKEIEKKGGEVKTNVRVLKIEHNENECTVTDENNNSYTCDYLIIAMPPVLTNRIIFTPQLSSERIFINERNIMGSITKVIVLYDKPYWREKGFSGETLSDCIRTPVFNAYDDCRPNHEGNLQPALVIFLNASISREWSETNKRELSEKIILDTLSTYFKSPEMLAPQKIVWKVWGDEVPINGGPLAFFPPGVLSKIKNLRGPEGRIHWAGTEMATCSQGFMDGAIESGLRAASEVVESIKKGPWVKEEIKEDLRGESWFKNIVHTPKKWVEWF